MLNTRPMTSFTAHRDLKSKQRQPDTNSQHYPLTLNLNTLAQTASLTRFRHHPLMPISDKRVTRPTLTSNTI